MASATRSRWILASVLLICIGTVWWARRRPPQYQIAYVGDRAATLWSTTALVRQEVGAVAYGEKVSIIRQSGDQVEVRTANGTQGWMDGHLLMNPGMWQEVADLLAQARTIPPQATGHTRALSNLHATPGRETPRIFQFGRNVPVVILGRRVVSAPRPGGSSVEEPDAANAGKLEDWLYVMRDTRNAVPPAGAVRAVGVSTSLSGASGGVRAGEIAGAGTSIAGWILARFIELDPPQPISDYASSAAMRIVAWTVLNTVPDENGDKPQYLVAGIHGSEGQSCDFTSLRVYTWGARARHYETAYVENNLCGRMPIVAQQTSGGADFHFDDLEGADQSPRLYRMKQTVVRRVKAAEAQTPRSKPRTGKAR